MRYFIYPYKTGSKSAKALATAIEGKVIRTEGSRFRPRSFKKVINWGSTKCPYEALNSHEAVAKVGNKLTAFSSWLETGVRLPKFTEDKSEALSWLEKHSVVCRHKLTGHSGDGIEIVERGSSELPDAPLYVEYIKKDAEYRIHVFNGEVIDVQRKIKDPNREVTDWKVRSHHNGFIFVRRNSDGVSYRDAVSVDITQQALTAVSVSGLTFGAVDIIYNKKRDSAFVLEVNTAPGLEGGTINSYATAIRKFYEYRTSPES